MGALEIMGYDGKTRIRSFSDWESYAMPPERKLKQWKEGRSAFELGRIWTENNEPMVPPALIQLLDSHEGTRGTVFVSGVTEHETPLPFGNRGPRCHDLALRAEQNGVVTVCVEAKADESFGGSVSEELSKARKRPVTRFPERLDWLTRSLLGIAAFDDDERTVLSSVIAGLPYQLFSAISGTILEAEAKTATKAVLVIHEFRTVLTTDAKMELNGAALDRFFRLLLDRNGAADETFRLRPGQLFGPVSFIERFVAGSRQMPCHIPFFIGKIRSDYITR
jgi:hypothetical protein